MDSWHSIDSLVFQVVQIVLRYSPIFFYTLMKQISFKGFSWIKISPDVQFHFPLNRSWYVTEQFSIRWLSVSLQSKWAWNEGYYWNSNVCFLPWHSSWIRQRRKIKTKTLQQTGWLHFYNSKLPFHQKQYSSMTGGWGLHFPIHALF